MEEKTVIVERKETGLKFAVFFRDNRFVAKLHPIPAFAYGETADEAVDRLCLAVKMWIEAAYEHRGNPNRHNNKSATRRR